MNEQTLDGLAALLDYTDDKITLNYPFALCHETGNIADYIRALVETVLLRAASSGLCGRFNFGFEMSADLWEGVSAVWACMTTVSDGQQVTIADIQSKAMAIQHSLILCVYGVEYPVILNDQKSLAFEPQEADAPIWLHGQITGIRVEKGGYNEGSSDWGRRYGPESCSRIRRDERRGVVRSL